MAKRILILDYPPQVVQVYERWLSEQPKPVQDNANKAIAKQAIAFAR